LNEGNPEIACGIFREKPAMAHSVSGFRPSLIERRRHRPGEYLARHCHCDPFAAVVLAGGYSEAGDRGRVKVTAGDVVLHGPYESHLDRVDAAGADQIVLPWNAGIPLSHIGRVDDPDFLARIAERDPREAAHYLEEHFRPAAASQDDWPDRLAHDLGNDPDLGIHDWADQAELRRESVARGFRRVYGVAPSAFRVRARTLKALAMIGLGDSLADIAAACGFADQSHMSRSVRRLTGHSPRQWLTTQTRRPAAHDQSRYSAPIGA
jgi:AraC-like DNA-binding protein